MPSSHSADYRFERFRLVPAERRLLEDEKPVKLGARAFDTLLALVEEHERPVSKGELIERAWPGRIVEENNLQVQISALRKVLGQQAIATIPGSGYQFTLPLERASSDMGEPPRPRNNLPKPLTSFVGHENDIAELARLLETTRLLTLTGIGGCGKTRLAIRLAETVLRSFADGTYFVDLAAIAEPQRAPLSLAGALGLREEADKPLDETLVRHLSSRQTLLVLDNCEHLLGVCAKLAERLLTSAAGLRIVVTSREGLGISGERLVPVRSLSLPAQSGADVDAVLQSEAVRLFVDRAADIAPGFRLTADNAAAVTDICTRLDGIPLALELAAARVKLLSVDQIRARLNDRFRLLTGSARMLSRHQTLLATLQWSYEHLAAAEQIWLRRLSVFAGGWTLEAATAVASDDRSESEALERLGRLVDQSVVLVDRSDSGAPRYSMLESVRQYAQDRLNESGEGEMLRTRHLDYFLALAERAHPRLFTAEAHLWYRRLDQELSNALAAHAWCDQDGEGAAKGLRLAAHMRMHWINRGLLALGEQIYREALARRGADRSSPFRARALFALGQHLVFRGRFADAIAVLDEGIAVAKAHGDRACEADLLDKLAYARASVGDMPGGLACIEQQIGLRISGQAPRELCRAVMTRADIRRMQGDFEAAASDLDEALAIVDRGDLEELHFLLSGRARVAIARGRLEQGREDLAAAIRLLGDMDSRYRKMVALDVASLLAAARADWLRAALLQGSFDATLSEMGAFQNPYDDRVLAQLREDTRAALGADAYAATYASGRVLSLERALAESLEWMERDVSRAPQ
jgi:predicted ATPase